MQDTDRETTLSFVILVSGATSHVLGISHRVPTAPRSKTRTSLISNKAILDADCKNTLSFVILVSRAIGRVLGIASRARHATVLNTDLLNF